MKRGKNYIGKDRLKTIINEQANNTPLPKDFDEWIREFAFADSHIIYYHKTDEGHKGYCTHCCQEVDIVDKPKQLQECMCPNCGINAKYSDAKYHTKYHSVRVSVLQACFEGVIERQFSVNKTDNKDKAPSITKWEDSRTYYGRGKFESRKEVVRYHSSWHSWHNGAPQIPYYSRYLYPNNLDFVYKLDGMQYCGIKEYARHCEFVSPIQYIVNYDPMYEKLVKAGLYEIASVLAKERINSYVFNRCNRNARDIQNFLNLGCVEDLRLAIRENVSVELLGGMSAYSRTLNRPLNNDDMRKIRFMQTQGIQQGGYVAFEYEHYIPLLSFIDYFQHQKKRWKEMRLSDYYDYIEACEKLHYNLEDTQYLKPKDFHKAHDEAMDSLRLETDKKSNRVLSRLAKKYMKLFAYETDKYAITMPKNTNDFINESKALGHCVKTYAGRVVDGTSLIFFIRQVGHEKTPFYTLELAPTQEYRLVQCRTKGNISMSGAVKKFVDKWIAKVVKPYVKKLAKKIA